MTAKFTLDIGWPALLSALGVSGDDLVRRAGVARDLLSRERPQVSAAEFARLWDAITGLIDHPHPEVVLGEAMAPEAFSPPLFAAYCSENLGAALKRLSAYKPLVGPLRLDLIETGGGIEARFAALPGVDLPTGYALSEFVFLVSLARRATGALVIPERVELFQPAPPLREVFGVPVRQGTENRIVFSAEDARRPFLSAHPGMFSVFDAELQAHLAALTRNEGMRTRVQAVLMEMLPAGETDVGTAARRLGVSARSLQRRLAEEGSSFKDELAALRTDLARHYLTGTTLSSAEISYLLGYADPNSFIRAFGGWTGTSPEALRSGRLG
jgi:AraC-like DNA-binding protein